jgi:UDP-N-acetylmuramate dehydrogenase
LDVDLEIQEDVPLAPLSTIGVGGIARYYTRATHPEAVAAALRWAAQRSLPVFVLGGGSNVIISDEGHAGLVLHVALRGVEAHQRDGEVDLRVAAGESWDELVGMAVGHGWAGIECLSGIPGLVGATPIQNVGAYGQDVSETLTSVETLDRQTLRQAVFSSEDCRFGYRESRFKREDRERHIVLAVTYRLRPGGAPAVRYAELVRHLEEQGRSSPTVAEVRAAVIELRRRKSMVLNPEDPNARSVGSFFVNPVVAADTFAAIQNAVGDDTTVPHWPMPGGRVKLSAAWLIERAGLVRGYSRGNVGLSSRHALAIVNRGNAAARDVIELAREVRGKVHERFGVLLTPEPVFVNVALEHAEVPSTAPAGTDL